MLYFQKQNVSDKKTDAGLCRAVHIGVVKCTIGGIDQERKASWGLFCCCETASHCEESTFQLCDETAIAGIEDASLWIHNCTIARSCVGVTVDHYSQVEVRRSVFAYNDAALETGFAGHTGAKLKLEGQHRLAMRVIRESERV